MKRLSLFCAAAALFLGSNAPPPRFLPPPPPAPVVAAAVAAAEEALIPAPAPTIVEPEPAPRLAPKPAKKAKRPASKKASLQVPPADGRLRVLVSLKEQKAYVFRGGRLIETSPVSTGKAGHETPTGTFRVLQKKVHHRSSKYDNAPMPYMQRLTNYGIALHAGRLPGYPASHGCIRLPTGFAKRLYAMTDHGTTVTVTRSAPKLPRKAPRARA